jgi:hypothetical protein
MNTNNNRFADFERYHYPTGRPNYDEDEAERERVAISNSKIEKIKSSGSESFREKHTSVST